VGRPGGLATGTSWWPGWLAWGLVCEVARAVLSQVLASLAGSSGGYSMVTGSAGLGLLGRAGLVQSDGPVGQTVGLLAALGGSRYGTGRPQKILQKHTPLDKIHNFTTSLPFPPPHILGRRESNVFLHNMFIMARKVRSIGFNCAGSFRRLS